MKPETRKLIMAELEPLFAKAEKRGFWFYAQYHDIWFSPFELRAMHKEGRFVWSAVNWQIRSPKYHLMELVNKVQFAEEAVANFKKRMLP